MKIRLLFAMSTLNSYDKSTFIFPDEILNGKDKNNTDNQVNTIENCIGQLEPIPKYILKNFTKDTLELVVLCSDQVVELCKSKSYSPVSYFVSRIVDFLNERNMGSDNTSYKSKEFDEKEYSELYERFRTDDIFAHGYKYESGIVSFKFIKFNEDELMNEIKTVVDYLRQSEKKDKAELWIDTHGGFRDAALILNSVVSLLKVYNIVPAKILGVRHGGDTRKIVDQYASFRMFDFVAGMNEFINFGSADSLVEFFEKNKETSSKSLVDAMKTISDGTRLCDPGMYKKGLDELGVAIEEIDSTDELLGIFIEYIKEDYGVLLDKGKRTNLDIIERCYNKKLYQQAMTFIESLMPEDLVDSKVLYYDESDDGKANTYAKALGKTYLPNKHVMFDTYLYELKGWYSDDEKDYKASPFKDSIQKKDFASIYAINAKYKRLYTDLELKGHKPCIFKDNSSENEYGTITFYTNAKSEEAKNNIGKLLRLHKAIKNCRNLTNHAKEGFRPNVDDIIDGVKNYICLAKEVLSDDFSDKWRKKIGEVRVASGSNANSSEKKNEKVNQANSGQKFEAHNDKFKVSKIGVNSKGKKNIQGTLSDGSAATIPCNYVIPKYVDLVNLKNLIGNTIEVIVEGENTGKYQCKPIKG